MDPPSKLLEQVASITRPKVEEHFLIVMDKSTHGEHLSQSLRTNRKHSKIVLTVLTGYNGFFIVKLSISKSISQHQILKMISVLLPLQQELMN